MLLPENEIPSQRNEKHYSKVYKYCIVSEGTRYFGTIVLDRYIEKDELATYMFMEAANRAAHQHADWNACNVRLLLKSV